MASFTSKIEPPYREALTGILSFASFDAAEKTLKCLEILRRNYHSANDKKGVEYCRQIALLGRRRAEFIGRNKRVSLQKRRQKQEIAAWFGIWLETPAIFDDWLALRKKTEAFQELLQSEIEDSSRSGDRHASGFKRT
jgi:hypothetical protein